MELVPATHISQLSKLKTFQQYIESQRANGVTEFKIILHPETHNLKSKFYIHPLNRHGESKDYEVYENLMYDATKYFAPIIKPPTSESAYIG